jgi:hypothetical protein
MYFNQSNPSITLPHPFPIPFIVQVPVCFAVSCSYIDVMYFNIINSLIFSSHYWKCLQYISITYF